jgi:pimeloyl-ACP methyl ester carboxylesterase
MSEGLSLLLAAALSGHHVVSTAVQDLHPSLTRTVYEVAVGDDPLNHFAITRVHKKHGHSDGSLILTSPFLLPGSFYEISESGRYADSAAGLLAQADVDVWLVDQRRTGLAPGACESGAANCSVMGTWDFNAYSNDALFALSLVKAEHPREKPVIGGFSAGSNAALATVNRAPGEFAGLFLYEGTFFTEDAAIAAHNDTICTNLTAALAAGSVFDPSAAVIGLVVRSARDDRAGLFPLPIFPPGTTNQQALLFVFGAPPPPGALSPTPGFVRCAADFAREKFVFTNQARLELTGDLFDNYGSIAAVRDLSCGLAGRDRSHFDRAGTFRGDVLVFVEGTGFGPAMFDTAGLFERAHSVTIDSNPELGEADPYFHRHWERVFFKPLRNWLRRTF